MQAENVELISAVGLQTWAGRRFYAVEVCGETRARTRVSLTHSRSPKYVRLPGGRIKSHGDSFLVPKHAVFHVPASKLEPDNYQGHIDGYSGLYKSVDVRQ